jgi:hypothetical protein
MRLRPCVLCQCLVGLGVCFGSSGCIWLGAYPVVRDTNRQLHEIRVADADTRQQVPGAKVALETDWGNTYQGVEAANEDRQKVDAVVAASENRYWWSPNRRLTQQANGAFAVPRRYELLLGVIGVSFADGPGYFGPFVGKGDPVLLDRQAIVTAWAPGYAPLQVAYDAAGATDTIRGDKTDGDFDYEHGGGVLTLYLHRETPYAGNGAAAGASLGESVNGDDSRFCILPVAGRENGLNH